MSTAQQDYLPANDTVTFTGENTIMCLDVSTVQDSTVESLEAFTVVVDNTDPAVTVDLSRSIGYIFDDDCKMTIETSTEELLYRNPFLIL